MLHRVDFRKFVLRFSALCSGVCSPHAQFAWGPAEQPSFFRACAACRQHLLILLAEYRAHPWQHQQRFPHSQGPAQHTGYAEPDSALELFTTSCAASCTPTLLPRFVLSSFLIVISGYPDFSLIFFRGSTKSHF